MTTVTAVTAFRSAEAVCKTSSRSSRLSRGAGAKVKGGIPAGGDCRKSIQPVPLDFWPAENTCRVVGKAVPFPPAQRRVAKFRRGAGCPFQRAALLGEPSADGGGKAPIPPRESPRHFADRRDESVIVGYYTSRRKCLPRTPVLFQQPDV